MSKKLDDIKYVQGYFKGLGSPSSSIDIKCMQAYINKYFEEQSDYTELVESAYQFCISETDFSEVVVKNPMLYGLLHNISTTLAEYKQDFYVLNDAMVMSQTQPGQQFRVEPMKNLAEAATSGASTSSNIQKVGYFNNMLEVEFKTGDSYIYFVEPDMYDRFVAAPSKGQFLWNELRGKKIGLVWGYATGTGSKMKYTPGGVGGSLVKYAKGTSGAPEYEPRLPSDKERQLVEKEIQIQFLGKGLKWRETAEELKRQETMTELRGMFAIGKQKEQKKDLDIKDDTMASLVAWVMEKLKVDDEEEAIKIAFKIINSNKHKESKEKDPTKKPDWEKDVDWEKEKQKREEKARKAKEAEEKAKKEKEAKEKAKKEKEQELENLKSIRITPTAKDILKDLKQSPRGLYRQNLLMYGVSQTVQKALGQLVENKFIQVDKTERRYVYTITPLGIKYFEATMRDTTFLSGTQEKYPDKFYHPKDLREKLEKELHDKLIISKKYSLDEYIHRYKVESINNFMKILPASSMQTVDSIGLYTKEEIMPGAGEKFGYDIGGMYSAWSNHVGVNMSYGSESWLRKVVAHELGHVVFRNQLTYHESRKVHELYNDFKNQVIINGVSYAAKNANEFFAESYSYYVIEKLNADPEHEYSKNFFYKMEPVKEFMSKILAKYDFIIKFDGIIKIMSDKDDNDKAGIIFSYMKEGVHYYGFKEIPKDITIEKAEKMVKDKDATFIGSKELEKMKGDSKKDFIGIPIVSDLITTNIINDFGVCKKRYDLLYDFYHTDNEEEKSKLQNSITKHKIIGDTELRGVITRAGAFKYGNRIVHKDWANIVENAEKHPVLPVFGSKYTNPHKEENIQHLIGFVDSWGQDNPNEEWLYGTIHTFEPIEKLSDLKNPENIQVSLSMFDQAPDNAPYQDIVGFRNVAIALNNQLDGRCKSVDGFGQCAVSPINNIIHANLDNNSKLEKDFTNVKLSSPKSGTYKIITQKRDLNMPDNKMKEQIAKVIADFKTQQKDDNSILTGNEVLGHTHYDEFVKNMLDEGFSPAAIESAWSKFMAMGKEAGSQIDSTTEGFVKTPSGIGDFEEKIKSLSEQIAKQETMIKKYEDFYKAEQAKIEADLKAKYKEPLSEAGKEIVEKLDFETLEKVKPILDLYIQEHPEILPTDKNSQEISDINTNEILKLLGKSKEDLRQAKDDMTAMKEEAVRAMEEKWK